MDHHGVMRPTTLEEFEQVWAWHYLPYKLAQKYYPDVVTSTKLPENLKLAFLLKDKETVLKHGAATVPEAPGTPLVRTLEQIIPGTHLPLMGEQGAQCFAPIPGKHDRFCVIYAVEPTHLQ